MTNLTTKQVNYLNKMFRFLVPVIALGTLIETMINQINDDNTIPVTTGTPVNAANASKIMTIAGAVFNGETVTVGSDKYEFASSTDLVVTTVGNIPVDINAHTAKASGLLTIDVNPTSGNTMTIGTKVYTFVPNGTANADGEIDVELTLAGTQTNVIAAIMGTDLFNDPHPTVEVVNGAFIANVLTVSAIYGGAAGNSIATTETFTASTNVFAGVVLSGGSSCTQANAVIALALAVTTFDTEGVGAVDGAGDTVVFTSDVAGVAGNSIAIAETMTNGSFAGGAVFLSGGINGTVGVDGEIYKDATYLYIAVDDNTIVDKNWRRVTLGSAY